MRVQTRLLVTMAILVVLPLSVAGVAWVGLWQMSNRLDAVSEEFAEARALQPIDADLTVVVVALRQETPAFDEIARARLARAQAALVEYLATQYDSVASDEHQAMESSHAGAMLVALESLLNSFRDDQTDGDERTAQAIALRDELRTLYTDAESGVQTAQRSAKATQRATMSIVLTASIATAVLCIGLSIWSTRGVNRRLVDLHRRLSVRSEGVVPRDPQDVGLVVNQIEAINERMLARMEENARELLRRERMAGVGLLAADVAHEINNPMNAMLGLSEVALRTAERGAIDEQGSAEMAESLRVIRREAMRCKGIVERLMAMVRAGREPSWFDANRLLRETVEVASAARPDRAACYRLAGAQMALPVLAPQEDVRQILLTLLINAADAIDADGRIEVDATRTDDEVWLRVRDDGRGFSAEERSDFFTPFRTSRAGQGGAGLGLSIAHTLAEDLGAEIRPFSDGPGRGSLFILAIPIRSEDAA
jgi:signal transduction histidine kinase